MDSSAGKGRGAIHPGVRHLVGSSASSKGVAVNLLLVAAKLAAGLLAGSVSAVADALNNLMDAAGSLIAWAGFKMAGKKADQEHPFGHGRYEYLAGLGAAVLIMVVGLELGRSGITEILRPTPLRLSPLLLAVLLLSIGVKLWMAAYYGRLGRRMGSSALKAVAADSRNDVVATGAVLISALLFHFTGLQLDGWAAVLISLFIIYNGWGLVKETVSQLVGEAPPPELVDYIAEKISRHEQVLGIHDLIVHDYGPGRRYVSAHVEMPGDEDPLVTHAIIDSIERRFLEEDQIHLIIHYDPVPRE
ncbi:MAG TPA: cation diffusion facilitator family transporter [Limnochordia bacterium]|nr:cation diffusion facilitator family transporter [Limnochordia bacterium]